MSDTKNKDSSKNLLQFSPYVIFLVIYSFLYFYFNVYAKNIYQLSQVIMTGIPLFSTLLTIIYSFFTYKYKIKIDKKIEIFFSGIGNIHIINSYFTIISLGIFNYMAAKTNGILTLITLSLLHISTSYIIIYLFILSSIITIILTSLPVAIIICMPIAHGIGQSLQIPIGLIAATIIGGALFGHHTLSYYHAIKNKITLSPKNTYNIIMQDPHWIIIPASIISFIFLLQFQYPKIHLFIYQQIQKSFKNDMYINIIPYLFLLTGAFLDINLIINLIISSLITLCIIIFYHKILFLNAITSILTNFSLNCFIFNILLLHFMIAGLRKIIEYNDGFHYIEEKLKPKNYFGSKKIKYIIILLTIIKNVLTSIDIKYYNSLTPTIKKITNKFKISYNEIITLSYFMTTIIQSILPYSIIVLWTLCTIPCSYLDVIFYAVYPITLCILIIISITTSTIKVNRKII